MKENKLINLGMLLVLSVLVMPGVMAAVVWDAPAVNSNHSSDITVTVTFTNGTDFTDPTEDNTTLYYNTSTTGWTEVAFTDWAMTEGQVTGTLAITSITDGYPIGLNMTLGNDSTILEGIVLAGLTIDDTDPTVTLEVQLAGETQHYGNLLDYKCGLSDAIDSTLSTQTFTVTHPSGDSPSSTVLTRNANAFLQFLDTDYPGDYVFTCSATDYAGNTGSSSSTVSVDELGNLVKAKSSNGMNSQLIWVILGVVAWFVFGKKK